MGQACDAIEALVPEPTEHRAIDEELEHEIDANVNKCKELCGGAMPCCFDRNAPKQIGEHGEEVACDYLTTPNCVIHQECKVLYDIHHTHDYLAPKLHPDEFVNTDG